MDERRARIGRWLVLVLVAAMVAPVLEVSTAGPAAAAASVTVVSSMRNVRPDQPVPAGSASASVTAARNEFESFQIVISGGGQVLTNVDVAVTTPIGDIPTANVVIHREEYFDAVASSDDEGAVGRWGDALIPETDPIYGEDRTAFPIPTVPATENRVAWVDVLVPDDHPAGVFTGAITVTADGGFSSVIPVDLQVLNLTLPSTPSLDSAFFLGYVHGPCLQFTGTTNCGGDTELKWKLSTLFARLGLENRVTIPNPTPHGGLTAPAATGLDNERFQRYFLPLVDGASPQPPAGHDAWSAVRLAGAALTRVALYGYVDYGCLEACTARWKQEATAHGFADRTFLYACDEPHLNATKWTNCDTYNQQAATGWPELPFEVTGSLAETDWWYGAGSNPVKLHVPNIIFLDTASRAAYDTWLGTPGNELWLYTACDSFGCDGGSGETNPTYDGLPGYAIDAPAIQHRAAPLLAFAFDVSGELYYDVLRFGCTNLYDGCGGTTAFGANGDGVLFYPGLTCTDGADERCIGGTNPIPIESVRLKRHRDGMEDYEYLRYLEENGLGAQARSVLSAYLPGARSATPDKDAGFDSMREQLISLIESLVGAPTVPGAPTGVVGAAGDGQVSLSWTAPADDGGSPITGYQVMRTPGNVTTSVGPTSSAVITGLANGTGYTFTVRAVNGVGPGAASVPSSTVTPTGSTLGTIAYASADPTCPGSMCIWTMNPDGTGKTRLTSAPVGSEDRFPSISPDGSHVLFTRASGADADIWIVDIDGVAPTPLVTGPTRDEKPAWSSDGEAVAFVRGSSPTMAIYRIDRTTGWQFGSPTAVLERAGDDFDPAWSPDGTQLVFANSSGSSNGWDIRRVTATGGGEVGITGGVAGEDDSPTWSHDGATIAFDRAAGAPYDVWTVSPDGTGPTNVTAGTPSTHEFQPVFSPDDQRLLYVTTSGGDQELVVDEVGAGTPTPLTSNAVTDRDPDWVLGDGSITAPRPPRSVGAVPGDSSVTVSWIAPVSDGGSPRTGYTVTAQPGGATIDVGPTATSAVVPGLGPEAYTFSVVARNASGPSLAALSDPVSLLRPGFHPITPTRVLDSRDGTGGYSTPWSQGASRNLDLGGVVPASATAVVLNVTATGPTAATHLTVWPRGAARPTASNLNMVAGQTVPNLVVVKLGVGDDVSIFNNSGSVDVIADLVGWFDPTTGGGLHGVVPTRLVDSRDGTGGISGPWGAGQSRAVQVTGLAGVPADATAVVVNVTVTGPTVASHLTVYPDGGAVPLASNLNFVAGQTVPNLVMVKVGTAGRIRVFNNAGSTHAIVDLVGWYR